jgi:hypothetical protein
MMKYIFAGWTAPTIPQCSNNVFMDVSKMVLDFGAGYSNKIFLQQYTTG